VSLRFLSGRIVTTQRIFNAGRKQLHVLVYLKERGETNLDIRAVAGSASSAFGRNDESSDESNDEDSDSGADVATETVIMVGPYSGVTIRAVT
jgi:hypothetical protein